ncbi:scabin-related ADP-ribosyltransferase [Streptomyces flavidovirens]|uniref:scabin-related ADP-ribosyltransferase n=1 Tax=Streptomyces flavidovirens TaxID=67298 RepID=UPI003F55AF89
MIEPSGIPHFSGNLDQLDLDVSALRSDAIGIRNGGRDVHSRFQALEGVYKAPEAGQLFATTRPVMDKAETFATNLETVADALDTFSIEARPLAKKLAQLKADALAFVDSVKGDDEWTDDEDKINRHQELLDGVSAARAAFQEAENRAASKISAIVGGPKFVFDDGSHTANDKTVMYGNDLDTLKHAEELPWGAPVSETGFGYWAKSFVWDGLIVDNIWGGLKGLGTLVGIGDDDTSDAWSHLWDVAGGIGQYTATPYNWLLDQALGEEPKDPEVERQKQATRDFGKALVGWDMWEENPARAAATVTFTLLTLGSGALATGAKAGSGGALAKTAGAASKVGTWIDPLSAGLKVSSKAVGSMPRLSEVTASIRSAFDTTATSQRLHSVIELENGSKVVIKDGEFIPVDADGKINTTAPRQEAPAGAHATPEEAPAQRDLAAVGAHPRAPEASAHAGGDLPPRANHESPVGANATSAAERGASGGAEAVRGDNSAPSGHYTPGGPIDSRHASAGGGRGDGNGPPESASLPDEGPDPLAAATDRSVDLGRLGMPVVWRTEDQPLFRSDNRPPEEVFESGFDPLDPSKTDLAEYVDGSDPSAFVSTSYRDDIGDDFGGKYTYEIDVPGGIDVNRSLGDHPLSYEKEVAFPGGIRSEYIKGARPYDYRTGEVGELIPNPNYIPEADRVP